MYGVYVHFRSWIILVALDFGGGDPLKETSDSWWIVGFNTGGHIMTCGREKSLGWYTLTLEQILRNGLLTEVVLNLLRHLYTRVAAQGLHHRICATKGFHGPSYGCQCTLCGGLCNMYHIIKCTRRTLTLSHDADDTNFQWHVIYTVHSVFNKSSTIKKTLKIMVLYIFLFQYTSICLQLHNLTRYLQKWLWKATSHYLITFWAIAEEC